MAIKSTDQNRDVGLKSAGHAVRSPRQAIGLSEAGTSPVAYPWPQGDRNVRVGRNLGSLLGAIVAGLVVSGAAGAQPARDSSGPQTAVPAPLPPGQADVPGGSAHNGVIAPPSTGSTMPVVRPPAHGRTPVIRPPGTSRGARPIQPK